MTAVIVALVNFAITYQYCILGVCSPCTHGDMRLVDGSVPSEGRVEVCVDGQWGTVCSSLWWNYNSWTKANSDVACRQLGYYGGK